MLKWTTLIVVAVAAVMTATSLLNDSNDTIVPRTAAEFKPNLTSAPVRLKAVYDQPNALLGGGFAAYSDRLVQLRGVPVVVNQWASWCGPCRAEMPHFEQVARKYGGKVAFLGVNNEDKRPAATRFLKLIPLPYPSYRDPHSEIAGKLGTLANPITTFYSKTGKIVHTKLGPYDSEADLAADIEKHALTTS